MLAPIKGKFLPKKYPILTYSDFTKQELVFRFVSREVMIFEGKGYWTATSLYDNKTPKYDYLVYRVDVDFAHKFDFINPLDETLDELENFLVFFVLDYSDNQIKLLTLSESKSEHFKDFLDTHGISLHKKISVIKDSIEDPENYFFEKANESFNYDLTIINPLAVLDQNFSTKRLSQLASLSMASVNDLMLADTVQNIM